MPKDQMVVVVDDDASFRGALVALLDSLDYQSRGFASAEEFLAAETTDYFCVITDIHMPGMSGFDLQRQLANRLSRIPVILVTARSEPGLEGKAMASGAICLLKKPFQTQALMHCIELALAA